MSEKMPGNPNNKAGPEMERLDGDGRPDRIVTEIIKYISTGTVLELGAGDGRHSRFLAEKGFAVTAWDTSQEKLDTLNRLAKEKGLSIQTKAKKISDLGSLDHNFDVLVCTYVLHHLSRKDARLLIEEMQTHTNIGGLNTIAAFTENGDFYRDNPETENFYLQENELKRLYPESEWEILEYPEEAETQAHQTRPDGSHMVNVSARLIAKKKK